MDFICYYRNKFTFDLIYFPSLRAPQLYFSKLSYIFYQTFPKQIIIINLAIMSNGPDVKNQYLPDLLPFDKKTPSKNAKDIDDVNKQKGVENMKPNGIEDPKSKQTANNIKPQMKESSNHKKQSQNQHRENTELKKRNQISKALINEMIKKISVKSITEQNYPVSNQTIERLILELNIEIDMLSSQLAKLQNALAMNPINQHLKREIKGVQKSLNQIQTIKQLYTQKSENRNKISELESKITQLKSQNRELKIKISRGIEKIQSHIHNLPCEREKLLIQEVNKYKQELDRQKKMRLNLEGNIRTIVLNFKRFYVEADEARKIITAQLKQINQRRQAALKTEKSYSRLSQKNKGSTDIKGIKIEDIANHQQRGQRKMSNHSRFQQEENIPELLNKNYKWIRPNQGENQKSRVQIGLTRKLSQIEQEKQSIKKGFSLEDQIKKMRTNQVLFSKLSKRNL